MPEDKNKRADNPWDAAKSLPCVRGNHMYPPADLEPGVKFFVLMLEKLGCTTLFSCEGHPARFYVVFHGPHRVAAAVAACGGIDVEVNRTGYRMSLDRVELDARRKGREFTARLRDLVLRYAASAWADRFGPLDDATAPPAGLDALDALVAVASVPAYSSDLYPELRVAIADAVAAIAVLRDQQAGRMPELPVITRHTP